MESKDQHALPSKKDKVKKTESKPIAYGSSIQTDGNAHRLHNLEKSKANDDQSTK